MAENAISVVSLTPEQFSRLEKYFDEAQGLSPPFRRALIERAKKEEGAELADYLQKLLAAQTDETETAFEPFVKLEERFRSARRAFQDGDLILNRFRIIRFIDGGGMGEVYEAQDSDTGRVALKTIRHDNRGDRSLIRRFKREVQLARHVTSPYVCRIHDVFTKEAEGNRPAIVFLTMEFLEGTTLADRIEAKGALPWREAEAIALQMCEGLEAIHRAGVIHRDFKSRNVMLTTRNDERAAVVMDLGLAYQADHKKPKDGNPLSVVGAIMGTPAYMSPEQFEAGGVSRATDIYALGVSLYEMVTGKLPFEASTPMAAAVRRAKRPPCASSIRPGVPSRWDKVIEKCLEYEPADRFQSAAEVAAALTGKRHGAAQGPAALGTRRKLIISGAATLALLCGGALKREELESLADRLAHPLPRRRFVAVVAWPGTPDHGILDTLSGVIDAIEAELSRAEAFDNDFFVAASHNSTEGAADGAKLAQIVDSLGTNLVLAAVGAVSGKLFHLTLKLINFSSGQILRTKRVPTDGGRPADLPTVAVQTAASLLGVSTYVNPGQRLRRPTESSEAFKALQAADALRKQPNDSGLEAAIEKYKEALDLDSHFAAANSRLAMAYCRLHELGHDPAALDAAEENARTALNGDPTLVEGHLALNWVFRNRGDQDAALSEISNAIKLDPSNPKTRVWQGNFYTALNRFPDAEAAYRRVLTLRPTYWLAHEGLGFVLDRQCKYQEALKEFHAASLAARKNITPLTNLAMVQLKLGMYAEARQTFGKSLALNPSAPACLGLAQLLRATGHLTEALQRARQAVELDSVYHEGWVELGDCIILSGGSRSEAKQAYLRAFKEAELKLKSSAEPQTGMLLGLYRLKAGGGGSPLDEIAKAESAGAIDPDSQLVKIRMLELIGQRDRALDTVAACLRVGVTVFQVDLLPDLQELRRDPRFSKITKEKSV